MYLKSHRPATTHSTHDVRTDFLQPVLRTLRIAPRLRGGPKAHQAGALSFAAHTGKGGANYLDGQLWPMSKRATGEHLIATDQNQKYTDLQPQKA